MEVVTKDIRRDYVALRESSRNTGWGDERTGERKSHLHL